MLLVVGAMLCAGALSDAATTRPSVLRSANEITNDLTAMIEWYDHVTTFTTTPVSVDETLYRDSVRGTAGQSVRLAFDLARAEAKLLAMTQADTPTTGPNAQKNNLAAIDASVQLRIADLTTQLADLDAQLAHPTTQPSEMLSAKRAMLLAALNLANERHEALENLTSFMSSPQNGGAPELLQKIDDLERTVPDLPPEPAPSASPSAENSPEPVGTPPSEASTKAPAAAAAANSTPTDQPSLNPLSSLAPVSASDTNDSSAPAPADPAGPPAFRPETAGIFGLISELFNLQGRMGQLNDLDAQARQLMKWSDEQSDPMRAQLRSALQLADALTASADSTSPSKIQAQTQKLQDLGERFRLLTLAVVPLSEQSMELKATSDHLTEWHRALSDTYESTLRYLLIRLGAMLGGILLVTVMSRLWRRATFKYVTDPRRRRVFLLVQRVVSASLIVLIMLMTFVTEFGSLATFAGLITAGVAVALQSIILAGVAYFFVVGRYGIRLGDRVTINGITGDVVETGLFRFYLMELAGAGFDLHPTGRIVVFSNAVLFQSTAMYKQIPGAEYVWHEVSMTLSPESDYKLAQDLLLAAVESVYDTYKIRIQQQHHIAASQVHLPLQEPQPQGRLRFVDAGLEFSIRYPVEIAKAAQIDDQITRTLLAKIETEPKLKMVVSGTPKIQRAA